MKNETSNKQETANSDLGSTSRSSFFQYLKNLIEIHGEQSFGIYEAATENTNDDQKVTLCCWGCKAKGYMLWSESWKKHFEHEKDCEFTKLMSEVQNCSN